MTPSLSLLALVVACCAMAVMAVDASHQLQNAPFPFELIMSDKCYNSLVVKMNLNDVGCIKMALSKLAGYAIVTLSGILKVPVFFNIWKNNTVSGLSEASLYLESSVYVCFASYNFLNHNPISTYGESIPLLIQDLILIMVVWLYNKKPVFHVMLVSAIGASGCTMVWGLPSSQRYLMMSWVGVASLMSRMPQIYMNYKNQHTGIQSLITTLLQVAGASVRMLTVIQEVSDKNVIASAALSTTLHTIILCQLLWYSTNTKKVLEVQKRDNSKKKKQ